VDKLKEQVLKLLIENKMIQDDANKLRRAFEVFFSNDVELNQAS
jgi:hypothetical protein